VFAVFAAIALLCACGDEAPVAPAPADRAPTSEQVTPSPTPVLQTATEARRGITVKTVSSAYGRIVADRHGQAFYLFEKELGRTSRCYGDCAKAWPPALTKGRPVAGKGVRTDLLGTTRRRDGSRQVTYGGRPVYYYGADSPGRVLCQDVTEFGGRWLVIRPDGRPAP
jgi:predicted lipoprotein with Yx(FWY)xxD motif